MPPLGLRQEQTTRQELALLPRMLQSIELLRIPWAELDAFLEDAAHSNEALRFERPVRREAGRSRGAAAEAADRHQAWLEALPSSAAGLTEHLEEQLALLDLSPRLESWTRFVIRCLDSRGYLTPPDETLLALAADEGLEGDATDLGRAIAVVQRLEPRGIGGRDAVESLLLQLDPRESEYPLLCRLIEEFVEELAHERLPAVARALGVDLDRLRHLLARLRELRLAPGSELVGEDAPPIRPDVVVRAADGRGERGPRFEVTIDQSELPAVSIDPEVERRARDRGEPAEVRRHLRGELERARWLVEGLEQRRRTLLRVASLVFARQRAFLERGPDHLVPLRMGEVADALELHLSTVSRAVAGKYAQTPFGVLPMRSFFPAAVAGSSEAVVGDVHRALRAIVAAEDETAPLSDDEIARRLARRGLRLARRTVAKHRRELGIPSSYRRRKAS